MHRRDLMTRTSAYMGLALLPQWARAHHGWSSFDQDRPLYLEGRVVQVQWRNPHAELVLALPDALRLPADLALRAVPAQTASVDGPALLAKTTLPRHRDKQWTVELAPLFRLGQWQMPEVKPETMLALVGFTFKGEDGAPLMRAEYVFLDGKTYGLRSSPT